MARKRASAPSRRTFRCARPGCSNEIEPTGRARHQLYCSPACRVGAFQGRRKVELVRRPCRNCGKLFMPDRATARFCTPECRWAWNGSQAAESRPRRRPAPRRKPAPRARRAAPARGRKAPGRRAARSRRA